MTYIVKNEDGSFTIPPDMILETTIGKREGGKTFQMLTGDFPANALEKFLRYGGQRTINDRVGGSDTNIDEKVAEAEAMIAAYMAGNVGRQPSAGVDPLTAECRAQARAALRATSPDKWKAFKDLDKDAQNDRLDAIVERNPALLEKAERELKRKAAEAKKPIAIDLDGMDI